MHRLFFYDEHMRGIQALVLVGGKATRLRKAGIAIPFSKAFMQLYGKPLLYWNLLGLYKAGVRRLILAADSVALLHEAHRVVRMLPYRFAAVTYFQDGGNGAHGIPYESQYLLDTHFIFECGHTINTPQQYQALLAAHHDGVVVFSGYTPHPSNPRQPVVLRGGCVDRAHRATPANGVIAHPMVVSKTYVASLLELGFTIETIIDRYIEEKRLCYVMNTMPAEYDTEEEMQEAFNVYRMYLKEYITRNQ